MASFGSAQRQIDEFWDSILSSNANPTVTSTLPRYVFPLATKADVPEPGVAENVMAGYLRAKEACVAKVDKISKECRRNNQKYNDPDFNLWNLSLCTKPLTIPPQEYIPGSVKRLKQIFDKPQFFVDGATADDVRQGQAGDCWFLSALCALCSIQAKDLGNLVEWICVHRDEAVGVYGFVFYRDGEWRDEIIDDKLYITARDYEDVETSEMDFLLKYIKDKNRAEQYRRIVQRNSEALYYARSAHECETWVPLIEKAYAKAHGDYEAIRGGYPGDGIEDLTGGLNSFFRSEDIVDLDKFWDEGLALVNKSFLWSCQTMTVNEQDARGIVGGHAYSILEAQTIDDGTRLLKVRNPWGDSEWDGDWSDRSKKWTDDLKKRLKHEDKDDGIFWISFDDLQRNYPLLHRTRIFDASWTVAQSWTTLTAPLLSAEVYDNAFTFSLPKPARTAIAVSQLDDKYYKGLEGQYVFSLSFRLYKSGETDYLYRAHARRFSDRSINIEVDLEAGEYEVRIKVDAEREPDRPMVKDVIKDSWKTAREKLLLTCKSYDLAHSKVPPRQVPEIEIEAEPEHPTIEEPAAAGANPEPQPTEQGLGTENEAPTDETPASTSENAVAATGLLAPGDADKPEKETPDVTPENVEQETTAGGLDADHPSDYSTSSNEPVVIDGAEVKASTEAKDHAPQTELPIRSPTTAPKPPRSSFSTPQPPVEVAPIHKDAADAVKKEEEQRQKRLTEERTKERQQIRDKNKPEVRLDTTPEDRDREREREFKEKENPDRDDDRRNPRRRSRPPPQPLPRERTRERDQLPRPLDDNISHPDRDDLPPPPSPAPSEPDNRSRRSDLDGVQSERGLPPPEPLEEEPSSTTCIVGLRVYCRDAEARIYRFGEAKKVEEKGDEEKGVSGEEDEKKEGDEKVSGDGEEKKAEAEDVVMEGSEEQPAVEGAEAEAKGEAKAEEKGPEQAAKEDVEEK